MRILHNILLISFWYILLTYSVNKVLAQELPEIYEESVAPTQLARLGNSILFFTCEEGRSTLWKSNGTKKGSEQVMQFDENMVPYILKTFDDVIFFTIGFTTSYSSGGGEAYRSLWITDGTKEGTVKITSGSAPYYSTNVPQGIRQPGSGLCNFQIVGKEKLYFIEKSQHGLDGDSARSEIWLYKQQSKTAKLVFEIQNEIHIPLLAVDEGKLYFYFQDHIWTADEDSVKKLLVYPLVTIGPIYIPPVQELQIEGIYYFTRHKEGYGAELWIKHKGEEKMLKDINPGVNSSYPSSFYRYGKYLIFSATTTKHGRELWISDGTTQGTMMVCDIVPGEGDSSPYHFTLDGKNLIFITMQYQLWKTDGTRKGTMMISSSLTKSAWDRTSPVQLHDFIICSGSVQGSNKGTEPVKKEGGRIEIIKDIYPGPNGSYPYSFIRCGDIILFIADDSVHGRELWRTDGTEKGTRMVKDINPGCADTQILEKAVSNDKLYFISCHNDGISRIHVSDGTKRGTRCIAECPKGSVMRALTPVKHNIFYLVETWNTTDHRNETNVSQETETVTELWKSTGKPSGATVIMQW